MHAATKCLVPKTLQDYNLAMGWDWQYFFEGKYVVETFFLIYYRIAEYCCRKCVHT